MVESLGILRMTKRGQGCIVGPRTASLKCYVAGLGKSTLTGSRAILIQLILCIHVTGELTMRGLIGMEYFLLMANSCGQQLKMSMLTHLYSRGHQEGPGN